MIRLPGILIATGCLVAGLALAQSVEPEVQAPMPKSPPVSGSPEVLRAPEPVPKPTPEIPTPRPPAVPLGPESPKLPNDPEPPEALTVQALVNLPGDWFETTVPGVLL